MCVWKTLLVLTKSNMNRRTTINPRTKATAKIPKSATEKCEGSIFEKTKRPFLQQLIQNGGLVDGHCACGAIHRLPSRNEFALITDPVKNKLPALWFFLTILFFFFSGRGRLSPTCDLYKQWFEFTNIAWRSPLSYALPHPGHWKGNFPVTQHSQWWPVQSCEQESGMTLNKIPWQDIFLTRQWFPVLSLAWNIHAIFLLVSSNDNRSKADINLSLKKIHSFSIYNFFGLIEN